MHKHPTDVFAKTDDYIQVYFSTHDELKIQYWKGTGSVEKLLLGFHVKFSLIRQAQSTGTLL